MELSVRGAKNSFSNNSANSGDTEMALDMQARRGDSSVEPCDLPAVAFRAEINLCPQQRITPLAFGPASSMCRANTVTYQLATAKDEAAGS